MNYITRKKRSTVFGVLLLLFVSFLFIGCSRQEEVVEEPTADPGPAVVITTEPEPEPKPEPEEVIPPNQNLLTGVPDLTDEAIGKRPIAVVIGNTGPVMPQYGIGAADIVMEFPVEGWQTRMVGLYGDYTQVPRIVPVRSRRSYFVQFSLGFDAVFAHWGTDDSILSYLAQLQYYDNLDGGRNPGGLFGRDQARRNAGYAVEHSSFMDGPKIPEALNSLNIRTDLREEKLGPAFSFNGLNEIVTPEGDVATSVKIDFGATNAGFTFDPETQKYLKDFNGRVQVDGATDEQLAFTNLLILETDVWVKDQWNRLEMTWAILHGHGYYVSDGQVIPIRWSKENEWDYIHLFDESLNPLSINRGRTYIAVNRPDRVTFE